MLNLLRLTSFVSLVFVLMATTACQSQTQTISKSEIRRTMPNSNYQYSSLTVQETRQVGHVSHTPVNYGTAQNYTSGSYQQDHHNHSHEYWDTTDIPNYDDWLTTHDYYRYQINEYKDYLTRQLGASNVPPMSQLLRTARSWQKCGAQPYQVPPRYLWANMVPTLKLYATLKQQGIVPHSAIIRSVYRNYSLNRCAGGASASKHLENSAIDIYVPGTENNRWAITNLQEGLCQFWLYHGQAHNFGLGLYATEAIHMDTSNYRKWGAHHTSSSSSCRF